MASASVYTGKGTAALPEKGQETLPLRVSRPGGMAVWKHVRSGEPEKEQFKDKETGR